MNKKASIELSTAVIVKGGLVLVLILIMTSFFTDAIPFLSNTSWIGRIIVMLALGFFFENVEYLLIRMVV